MNKDNSTKISKDDVLEDLEYDLDAMLVRSINEIKIFSYDTTSARVHEYLDVYYEQDEILIEMTNDY